MTRPTARGDRGDRGSATVELVLAAPVFALLLAFVVTVGRTQSSRADVEAAAHAAARAITLSRDPQGAIAAVRRDAEASLAVGSPTCRTMGWDVTLTPERATVTVSCAIDLSDAAMLPVPASYTVSATSDEVFDIHRENSDGFGISEGSGGSNPRVEGA
jgi:Flp pilus assembly protein TadG